MELGGGDRALEAGPDQEIADVCVGLEQDARWEQNVVDPDDALLVQLHVVKERRAAVELEIERVMEVVIEIRAGADDEVDQAPLHELDDAAAEAGRRERAGDGQADGGVAGRRQHLVGVDVAGLGEPPGVERLEPPLDELAGLRPARRPAVANRFPLEKTSRAMGRGPGRSVGHLKKIPYGTWGGPRLMYLDSGRSAERL